MRPKVSVVAPCYNKKDYIGAFLESVYRQEWDNIELILVNDGSTDGTREIISQWEPRLRERFEVAVIDQENQGVATAVKNGILRVTGRYVCVADCDDELYPDYASVMAEFLEARREYEWCICDFDVRFAEGGFIEKSEDHIMLGRIPTETANLEDFMYNRFARMVWRYMIRAEYLKKCAIAENMQLWNRTNHEMQFGIPLLAGGGKHGYVRKHLYLYNYEIPGITHKDSFQKRVDFENGLYKLIEGELKRLDIPEKEKDRLLAIADLHRAAYLLRMAVETPAWSGYIRAAAEMVADAACRRLKTAGGHEPLSAGFLTRNGRERMLFWKLEDFLFKDNAKASKIINGMKNKRVIAYGALGKIAARMTPELVDMGLAPDILWDKRATEGSELCGIAVTEPNIDALTGEDILLVLPKSGEVASEVRETLRRKGSDCRVYYYEDISEIWRELYFPQFFDGCELVY